MAADRALQHRAEELAATLPPLLVAAERVASTVSQGVHGRRRVGQGETFWQFRQYDRGDQPQSIDWRQSAKSDRVYVRELEWEAAQSVWLWRDASPSMGWRSAPSLAEKREVAELLLIALAALLQRAGEQVALIGSDERPSRGRLSLMRLADSLERNRDGAALPPRLPLPRHAQVVMFSDFLLPLEEIDASLRAYAARGVQGQVVQVLDPAEETLPYRGRVRFEGLEQEEPWLLSRVETTRAAYAERLAAQRAGLAAIAGSVGWGFIQHRSDRPPQTALLALYGALARDPRGF